MVPIEIQVNGEAKKFDSVSTVSQLLEHLGRNQFPCAVEVNRELVPKARHVQHQLKSGDQVELVTLVGGG